MLDLLGLKTLRTACMEWVREVEFGLDEGSGGGGGGDDDDDDDDDYYYYYY